MEDAARWEGTVFSEWLRKLVREGLENAHGRRTLRVGREECVHLHHFETLEEARTVIGAFIERYNTGWLLQRHGYMTPARAR